MGSKRFKFSDHSWGAGLFIIAYHIGLVVGLPFYFYFRTPSAALVAATVVLLFLSGIGIGAAYHRFYSHRCYTLSRPAEAVLLFLATVATQGSALRWSFEHRLHHTYVDTDDDPYSIRKGFWYAHVLWIFDKARPIEEKRVPDLLKNPLVRFQHRHYALLSMGSNVLVFALVGWLCQDLLGAFVLTWWTRLAVSHHLTWFVNSLAHCWGEQTYSKEHSAVDNYILAFLTVGEGYHNYHHTFASDYRNGARWYHFDPTKWTIWTLSKLGLAANLRRFSRVTIKRRLLLEDRKLLLATLKSQAHSRKLEIEQRIEQLAAAMQEKLARISALVEERKKLKNAREQGRLQTVRRELAALQQSFRQDWRNWGQLCRTVLASPTAAVRA